MSYKINSPEFAQAWRIVSDALLEYLQQGGTFPIDMSSSPSQPEDHSDDATQGKVAESYTDMTDVASAQKRELVAIRYVVTPIKQEDGSYIFKNLKDEQQNASTFKIKIFSDNSCEFELCEIMGDPQVFKDNMTERMPSEVCIKSGDLTADCTFKILHPGKGIFITTNNSRFVKILEPLKVQFT